MPLSQLDVYKRCWAPANKPIPKLILNGSWLVDQQWWSHSNDQVALPGTDGTTYLENLVTFSDSATVSELKKEVQRDKALEKAIEGEIATRIHRSIHEGSIIDQVLSPETQAYFSTIAGKALFILGFVVICYVGLFAALAWNSGLIRVNYQGSWPLEVSPGALLRAYDGPLRPYFRNNQTFSILTARLPVFIGNVDKLPYDRLRDLFRQSATDPLSSASDREHVLLEMLGGKGTDLEETIRLERIAFQKQFYLSTEESERVLLAIATVRRASKDNTFFESLRQERRNLLLTPLDIPGEIFSQIALIGLLLYLLVIFLRKKNILFKVINGENDPIWRLELVRAAELIIVKNYKTKKGFHYIIASLATLVILSIHSLYLTYDTEITRHNELFETIFLPWDFRTSYSGVLLLFVFYWLAKATIVYVIVLTGWEVRELQRCIVNILHLDVSETVRSKIDANQGVKDKYLRVLWQRTSRLATRRNLRNTRGLKDLIRSATTVLRQDKAETVTVFSLLIALQVLIASRRFTLEPRILTDNAILRVVYYSAPLGLTLFVLLYFCHVLYPFTASVWLRNMLLHEDLWWLLTNAGRATLPELAEHLRRLGLATGESQVRREA